MVSGEVDGQLPREAEWPSMDPRRFLVLFFFRAGGPRRGTQISYNSAKSVLSSSLLFIGYDEDFVKKFCLHSFRVGATSKAHSLG